MAWALGSGARLRQSFDLMHPQPLRIDSIVVATRAWLGFQEQPVWRVPRGLGRVMVAAADLLGRLGWRSPAQSTGLTQLEAGIAGDPARWMSETGIRPQSFADILAGRGATLQDRWFSRIYPLKPLAIGVLASMA